MSTLEVPPRRFDRSFWLYDKLEYVFSPDTPHDRHEAFGVLNTFLSAIFSPSQSFMVVPQGHILPMPAGMMCPDFAVVKATSSLYDDTVFLVIGVKVESLSVDMATRRLQDFLEAAKGGTVQHLRGVLVRHSVFDVYGLDKEGKAVRLEGDRDMGKHFIDLMYEIAQVASL